MTAFLSPCFCFFFFCVTVNEACGNSKSSEYEMHPAISVATVMENLIINRVAICLVLHINLLPSFNTDFVDCLAPCPLELDLNYQKYLRRLEKR